LGFAPRKPTRTPKPLAGHFKKANVSPTRYLGECRVAPEVAESYQVGQEVRCDLFQKGQRVDVIGTSKGRGTTGVVKRHNFPVHTEGHGTHEFFRHGGSIGANTFPGRVIKGLRMAGRHGNERVTVRNLEVVGVDRERNLLLVRGAVPGHPEALVRVRPAVAHRG
jgi:large subunit ribosomal protein L3